MHELEMVLAITPLRLQGVVEFQINEVQLHGAEPLPILKRLFPQP